MEVKRQAGSQDFPQTKGETRRQLWGHPAQEVVVRMGKEWLGEWDGQLCVVSEDTLSSAPVLIRKYWPVGIKAYDFKRNYGSDLMGRRVYPTGPSSHGIYGIEGVRFQVQLINGGQTRPVHFVKEPIKPPKVKAGIEVRYVEGRWQKYLKSRGWTDAKKGRSHAKKTQAKVTSKVKLWAEYCPECDGKSDVQGVQRDKVIFVCRECGRRWSRPVEVLYLHNKRTGELRLDPLAAVARATKNLHQKSQVKRGKRA